MTDTEQELVDAAPPARGLATRSLARSPLSRHGVAAATGTSSPPSELFSPNWIGGIKPADDICKQLANKADLPNPFTFTAWLSDSQSNAIDRLYPGQGRYLRPDGVVVALGAQQFTSATLLAPIQTDEYGEPLDPGGVWTGTGPDGIVVPGADNCSDWTSDSLLENGHLGDNSVMNDRWTFIADPDVNPTSRALSFHLYCIEGK